MLALSGRNVRRCLNVPCIHPSGVQICKSGWHLTRLVITCMGRRGNSFHPKRQLHKLQRGYGRYHGQGSACASGAADCQLHILHVCTTCKYHSSCLSHCVDDHCDDSIAFEGTLRSWLPIVITNEELWKAVEVDTEGEHILKRESNE